MVIRPSLGRSNCSWQENKIVEEINANIILYRFIFMLFRLLKIVRSALYCTPCRPEILHIRPLQGQNRLSLSYLMYAGSARLCCAVYFRILFLEKVMYEIYFLFPRFSTGCRIGHR